MYPIYIQNNHSRWLYQPNWNDSEWKDINQKHRSLESGQIIYNIALTLGWTPKNKICFADMTIIWQNQLQPIACTALRESGLSSRKRHWMEIKFPKAMNMLKYVEMINMIR